jgi:outer membrane receptor protein involved in Fe transport
MNPTTSRLTRLLGTASFLTLANSLAAQAETDQSPVDQPQIAQVQVTPSRIAQAQVAPQQPAQIQLAQVQVAQAQVAQAQTAQAQTAQAAPGEVPEQVLITGSLIRGTAAVGVPVTNLSVQDIRMTGSLTTSDLFRTIPQFNVIPGPVGTQAANVERGTRVNLRQLDTGSAPRSLMMIDGVRYPAQGMGLCQIDPSIIPTVAVDRIDLLLDGASATYGSDAIGGVINIILKRGYDGAQTEIGFTTGAGGNTKYLASQLWGRTWDGGDITIGYQWYDVAPTHGNFNSKYTFDFTPWGLDNRTPLASAMPGIISTGAPAAPDQTNYPATNGHNCTNCFSIPQGTGRDFNTINGGLGPLGGSTAATINWATFANPANGGPVNGTANEFNPYSITDYSAASQYVGSSVTFDQRLTKDISFYGEGFYGMRRSRFINNTVGNQLTLAVPTFNPYYPTNAPNGLRVSYNFSIESPSITNSYASAQRYLGGLNIDLPGDWAAQVYYSQTRDAEYNHVVGAVNRAAVSAALGWTMPATPATGTNPTIGTFTKPPTTPYLNLFCDTTTYQCNSPSTLAFIGAYNETAEAFWVDEKGFKADGPLFDLPGGPVKMAVGANYTSYRFLIQSNTETSTSNTAMTLLRDPESRRVWAVFGQLNVPVIGDNNSLPGVRKLELEASWRHDQYSDVGGTSNPKLAFNWEVSEDLGLTFRGSWGTSFRAPSFGEFSPISNVAWNGWGLQNAPGAAQFQNNATIQVACDASGKPPAGSGAEKLFNAGFACNSQPAGLSLNGGGKAAVDAHFRTYFNQDNQVLRPELSTNWGFGFDFAPTSFLRGLDVQATWYTVKINGILINFGNPTTNRFNDSSLAFVYLVPSDVGCPVAQNAHPEQCAAFQDMVQRALAHPTDPVPSAAQSLIYWINDGGTLNKGWQKTEGIDWSISYDWDLGDLGAWNTGMTGTYYLKQESVRVPGAAGPAGQVTDVLYDTDLASVGGVPQLGVESLPRFKYRARLGWSNGPWSVTGFMDYQGHFYHTQTAPPNVNFECLTAGGSVGGGTFPCALNNYTNIEPSYYTFDLAVGYDTGDTPVNEYLRNISIQLVVQNIMDKHAPFEYRTATGGGNPCACDILKNLFGRQTQIRIVKTW